MKIYEAVLKSSAEINDPLSELDNYERILATFPTEEEAREYIENFAEKIGGFKEDKDAERMGYSLIKEEDYLFPTTIELYIHSVRL